jgi:hypothetical protein
LKHRLVILALIFASTLLTAESAVAARIHNLTPIPLKITLFWPRGAERAKFAIGAGQQSPSLDYFDGGAFTVDDPSLDVTFCRFHQTKDLRGGNYLVIGHANGIIACTMCNSNRHQFHALPSKLPTRGKAQRK